MITYVTYKLKKYLENCGFNTEYAGINEKITELGFNKESISPVDFVQVITEIRK
ncbi:hypothetical protein II582_04970 [bacterium]|nr:hypothetical protein [bacterium]